MRRLWPALVLLVLTTCSSPPTHFYVLTPNSGAGGFTAGFGSRAPVVVGRVQLPGDLDRASIVTRVGPNQLNVSDQDRWAGPLDEMMQRVLASDLGERLPAGNVLAPGDPVPPGGARTVVVNIRQFIGDSSGRVVLQADWSVLPAKSQRPAETHREFLTATAASPQTADIVAAMSRLIGELSARIAGAIG